MGKKKAKKKKAPKMKLQGGSDISDDKLKALAKYALGHDNFRKNAAKKGAFIDELTKELKKAGTDDFDDISDDDKGYVAGWLDMVRLTYGDANGVVDDTTLKGQVDKHLAATKGPKTG